MGEVIRIPSVHGLVKCPLNIAPCAVQLSGIVLLSAGVAHCVCPLQPLFSCVDSMLDDILQTASDTGRELDHHNVQLGRMNKKVDKADTNITGLNARMSRQIRK